jgi:LemA protein
MLGWLVFILFLVGGWFAVKWWIRTYNRFVQSFVFAQQLHENIKTFLQKRSDNLLAMAEVTKRYDIHEHNTFKDTIAERGQMPKGDDSLVNAVVEQYPNLQAEQLHNSLMERTSQIENELNTSRATYNQTAQKYNTEIRTFPQNIVARTHHFEALSYLDFEKQEYSADSITKKFSQDIVRT